MITTATGHPILEARVTVKGDLELKARINRVLPQANRALNRGLINISRSFYQRFAAERLSGPPGIEVRRAGKSRTKMGVPGKARLLGFFSRIIPVKYLSGKKLRMWAGWPEIVIHETGGTVEPKKGEFLYLRHKPPGRSYEAKGEVFAKVRRVQLKPRLHFVATFEENVAEYRRLLDAAWQGLEQKI